jgi:pantoate kinase
LTQIANAFAPAAISSFFEICDQDSQGNPLTDLVRVGARGGGFGLQKGVHTTISVSKAEASNHFLVYLNGVLAPEAHTTINVLQTLLEATADRYNVVVEHKIDVPIGAGFGTSAGGALTAGLALKAALNLPLTLNQVAQAAHVAEIKCQTGLGTVSSLASGGGCILVVEPGAPGVCVIDHILLAREYVVVAGVFQGVSKTSVLSSPERRNEVNRFGRKTLDAILAEPSLETFLGCCWQFAQDAGFATSRVRQLVDLALKAGAIGAAQNMVGEAVHAVTVAEKAAEVAEAFKLVLPKENILVSKLDFQGARLVTTSDTV